MRNCNNFEDDDEGEVVSKKSLECVENDDLVGFMGGIIVISEKDVDNLE